MTDQNIEASKYVGANWVILLTANWLFCLVWRRILRERTNKLMLLYYNNNNVVCDTRADHYEKCFGCVLDSMSLKLIWSCLFIHGAICHKHIFLLFLCLWNKINTIQHGLIIFFIHVLQLDTKVPSWIYLQ